MSCSRLATKEQEIQVLQKEKEEKSRQAEEKIEQKQQVTSPKPSEDFKLCAEDHQYASPFISFII